MRRTVLLAAVVLGFVAYRFVTSRGNGTAGSPPEPEGDTVVDATAPGESGTEGAGIAHPSAARPGTSGSPSPGTDARDELATDIPFEAGLRLTYASSIDGQPDWESIVMVERADSDAAGLRISWNRGAGGRWKAVQRPLSRRERTRGRAFYAYAAENDTNEYRGFAYSMATTAVLADLERAASAEVAFLLPELASAPYRGTITRAAGTAEEVPMILDGDRVTLNGIRVRGRLRNPAGRVPWVDVELVLLDLPQSPWFLDSHVRIPDGRGGSKKLVRIATSKAERDLGSDLRDRCAASVHDLYFATASVELDRASSPALARIAAMLQANPDWRIRIVGHTDDVGGDEYNLDLSRRRAERVRETLVRDHGIDPGRLTAEGRGERQPLEDNGTPEGRARNRRVDLERGCDGAGQREERS